MQINKELVQKRFARNTDSYSQLAVIQLGMAEKLTNLLLDNRVAGFDKVLELGVGCGFLTKQLLNKYVVNQLYINDIIEALPQTVAKTISNHGLRNWQYLSGDAEKIQFPKELDLVISGATFQWFQEPEKVLEKAFNSLKNNGIIAISTFGLSNFKQIRQITGTGLKYMSISQLSSLTDKYFKKIHSSEIEIDLSFSSVIEILKHLKFTGVNAVQPLKWNKSQYLKFVEAYEKQFANSDKLLLTYNPMYFIGEKIG